MRRRVRDRPLRSAPQRAQPPDFRRLASGRSVDSSDEKRWGSSWSGGLPADRSATPTPKLGA